MYTSTTQRKRERGTWGCSNDTFVFKLIILGRTKSRDRPLQAASQPVAKLAHSLDLCCRTLLAFDEKRFLTTCLLWPEQQRPLKVQPCQHAKLKIKIAKSCCWLEVWSNCSSVHLIFLDISNMLSSYCCTVSRLQDVLPWDGWEIDTTDKGLYSAHGRPLPRGWVTITNDILEKIYLFMWHMIAAFIRRPWWHRWHMTVAWVSCCVCWDSTW